MERINVSMDIASRIARMCALYSTNEKEMEILGRTMLKLFRDVCRGTADVADDIFEDLCSDSEEMDDMKRMSESIVRLQFFTPDIERIRFEDDIHTIVDIGMMLKIMDVIKSKIYAFPDYGPEFVSILSMSYMSNFEFKVEDILEELKLSRSVYFRKKKYATILFGLMFFSLKTSLDTKTRTLSQGFEGYSGEQLRMQLF